MDMGIFMIKPARNAASDIRGLLEAESPRAYCDACLAFGFDVSLDEARAMAFMLTGEPGYVRERGTCDNCGRVVDTTSRTSGTQSPHRRESNSRGSEA
jgi:hypothetical protein